MNLSDGNKEAGVKQPHRRGMSLSKRLVSDSSEEDGNSRVWS